MNNLQTISFMLIIISHTFFLVALIDFNTLTQKPIELLNLSKANLLNYNINLAKKEITAFETGRSIIYLERGITWKYGNIYSENNYCHSICLT